jgi:hypothetical protein
MKQALALVAALFASAYVLAQLLLHVLQPLFVALAGHAH